MCDVCMCVCVYICTYAANISTMRDEGERDMGIIVLPALRGPQPAACFRFKEATASVDAHQSILHTASW